MKSKYNWQLGLANKRGEKISPTLQSRQLTRDSLSKVIFIDGGEVRETSVLGISPHAFVRVQVRGVAWQLLRDDARVLTEILPDDPGAIVNIAPVPNDCHGLAQLTIEKSKEPNDVVRVDVLVVRQQLKVQSESPPLGTHRDGADRRDTVSSVPTVVDRRLPPRCETSSHRGSEHKPGFVEEYERCAPSGGVFFRRRNSLTLQRSISSSLGSRARLAGFCDVQPSRCTRILRTWST